MVRAELVLVDEAAPKDGDVFGYWFGGSGTPTAVVVE